MSQSRPSLKVGLCQVFLIFPVTQLRYGVSFLASNKQGSDTMPRQEPQLRDKAPPVLCSVRSRTRPLSPKLSTIRTHDATSKSDSGVNGDTGFCCVRFAFIV